MSKKYNISFVLETDDDVKDDLQDIIWGLLQTGSVVYGPMSGNPDGITFPQSDHIIVKEVDEEHLPFKLYASRTSDHPIVEADGSDAKSVCAAKTLSELYPDIYCFRDNGYNVTVRYEPYKERIWTVVYDWYLLRSRPWINDGFFCDHPELL